MIPVEVFLQVVRSQDQTKIMWVNEDGESESSVVMMEIVVQDLPHSKGGRLSFGVLLREIHSKLLNSKKAEDRFGL